MKLTLKAARINAGFTQEQVKEKTGIARSTLTNWESGRTLPRSDKLKQICKLYGISTEEITLKKERAGCFDIPLSW